MNAIQENAGVSITTRGSYIAPGSAAAANMAISGLRRLHLLVEGETEVLINRAKREIMEIILEATQESLVKDPSRYLL